MNVTTLTKVSMRKTSHYHSPKQAHTSDNKCKRLPNNPGTRKPVKSSHNHSEKKVLCIIGGESAALGFHQETTEKQRNNKIGFV